MPEQSNNTNQIVEDKGSSPISDLWLKEDYWAIWLGALLLIAGLIIYLPKGSTTIQHEISQANQTLQAESQKAPFKTIAYFQALDTKKKLKATNSKIGRTIKKLTSKPHQWSHNPLNAFFMSQNQADVEKSKAIAKYKMAELAQTQALEQAKVTQRQAEINGFKNTKENMEAQSAIEKWRSAVAQSSKAKKKAKAIASYNQVPFFILLMLILALFFGVGMKVMGHSLKSFIIGFGFVFLIAVLAYGFASNTTMNHYGVGYAAWAILLGLIVSNTVGTPLWVKPAVQTEFYIKTGLVLLGAEILFGKILSIGLPGIFVAWVVTPIVLITTYWFGQKIVKIPSKTLNMTISADMSVCGVSAAIATAAACKAKKEELTLAVGLSLVFTSIMMIVMPAIIKAVDMPHVLGGAWMGGTIDATGAVAAAGAFLSEKALYVAATIKMIQNVLIGVIAFFVAIYWVAKVDRKEGQKVPITEIWHRFPKFVIGFISASIIFSVLYSAIGKDMAYVVIDHGAIRGLSKIFRGWFFCLAFASIGLATNFRELKSYFKGGKPLILYVCGQSLNLILTLLMAYIMFFLIFPEITAKI